jgi:hypothetical protein
MTIRSAGGRLVLLFVVLTLGLPGIWWLVGSARADQPAPITWSTQLRSTAYFFQQAEPGQTEVLDRLPIYEQVDAGVGGMLDGKLDMRFSGRYAKDAQFDGGVPEEGKWFVGYARLRLKPGRTQIRVGRQFIQEGSYFATLDGGWLSFRPHPQWRIHAWTGSTASATREFKFGDDFRMGARVLWLANSRLRLGVLGGHRTRDGKTLSTPLGAEAVLSPLLPLRSLVRANYDLETEELDRFDAMLMWRKRPDLPEAQIQYILRRQEYESGSWWEQFRKNLHAVQLLRGSVRWRNARGLGGELQGFGSFIDERKTGQIGAAFLAPHLRLGAGFLGGDAGEQVRVFGDVDWAFAHRLDLSAGAAFVEYAIVEDPADSQMRDLTTYYARAKLMIVPGAELMTELQVLDNPFYNHDVRLLVGLDLSAGRGASRYGLGSGGGH